MERLGLPESLCVNGKSYRIRTDFRKILTILIAFSDPNLEPGEKAYICLRKIYMDYALIPEGDVEEAYRAAVHFIDGGLGGDGRGPRTMDWEQDLPILWPSINRAAGQEVRSAEYLHWWTFLGYFMEIREGVFKTVVDIRRKKAKGKKLEKQEQEFWAANRKICELKEKLTESEKEEKERLLAMLG